MLKEAVKWRFIERKGSDVSSDAFRIGAFRQK